jgi:hypothetical protein
MYNIAMAVALGCRGGVDPNLAARHCLQSHADIGSPGRVLKLQGVPEKRKMPLVMLHLGSWYAVSQLALQAAMTFCSFGNFLMSTWMLWRCMCFPDDEAAARVEIRYWLYR